MTPLGRMTTTARKPTVTAKREFLERWMSDPEAYPEELKSWLINFVQQSPNLLLDPTQLPSHSGSKLLDDSSEGRKIRYHSGVDPPDSPSFGDYWLCTTPTTGGQSLWQLPWLFLYTNADPTYPWQFIGGTPIISSVMADASQSMAASVFQSPYPTDPNIDLARAGNYLVRIGATVRPATSTCSVFLGLRVGSSDPIIDAQWSTGGYCPVAGGRASLGVEIPISVVGAGTHLQLRYWQNGGTQNFVRNNAFISVIPYSVA